MKIHKILNYSEYNKNEETMQSNAGYGKMFSNRLENVRTWGITSPSAVDTKSEIARMLYKAASAGRQSVCGFCP